MPKQSHSRQMSSLILRLKFQMELSALSQEIETSHEMIDYVSPEPMVAIPSGIFNSLQHNIEYVF